MAFQGLRRLLASVARQGPVVLWIDDWHWVDADSVRLLSHVLEGPGAPPVLLLLTGRPGAGPPASLPCSVRRIALGNLDPQAAQDLAARLLRLGGRPAQGESARAIATESLGHPLFIAALARHVLAGEELTRIHPSLEGAIWSRVEALTEMARRAAELLAVSGVPLPLAVLQSALGYPERAVPWSEMSAVVVQLGRDDIARAMGVRPPDFVGCFHARVAAAIVAHVPPPTRGLRHRALAFALEQNGSEESDSLVEHWQEAGEPQRAAAYALRGADSAAHVLAFERACRLYRRYLELAPPDAERSAIYEKLGAALGHVGRGRESADAYLAAAAVDGERRIELHRLAADQLFRSGHIDEAVALIERVFPSLSLRFPKSAGEALVWLAIRRLRIRRRGIEFERRSVEQIAPEAIARVDAAWTVALGLATVDNLKGACVQSGNLFLALELGEPLRVLRALAAEAAYVGTVGTRARARVDELLSRATELAAEVDDPYALGFLHLARCFALYLRSEFRAARASGEDAEAVFERRPVLASWELTSARMLVIASHFYDGDLNVIRTRVPELVREAESRGDLYSATNFRLSICNNAWLIDDRSDQARSNLRLADESWRYQGVHMQQVWSLSAWGNLELYDGDPGAAYERVRSNWRAVSTSFVMRFERIRTELIWLRGRAALALAARDAPARRKMLGDAERCAKRLLRESAPWSPAAGHLLLAGVLAIRGESRASDAKLLEAAARARACGLQLIVRVHEHFTGTGGGFAGQVRRPDRWVRMLAPGLTAPADRAATVTPRGHRLG
jgi:hypothetical protein